MTDQAFGTTLGQHLRAARLRFGHMPGLGAYMRLTIVGDDLFRAELVPPDQVPKSATKEPHVLWYAPQGGDDLRPDLTRLCQRVVAGGRAARLRRPVAFLFDGDGDFRGWCPLASCA